MLAGYTGTTGPRGPVTPNGVFDSLTAWFIRTNGDSISNTRTAVTLNAGPRDEVGPMKDYWNNTVPIGSKRNLFAGPDSGRGSWDSTQVPWDFRYAASSPLYTAGTDGKPLGAVFMYGITVDVPRGGEMPQEFALAQNFPNPFNPSTSVEYTLPARMEVSVRVYSLLGQEVALLVQGMQDAGVHRVQFHAAGLPSGTYFCKLSAAAGTQIRKMVLLK
jgi:hypothetical protein